MSDKSKEINHLSIAYLGLTTLIFLLLLTHNFYLSKTLFILSIFLVWVPLLPNISNFLKKNGWLLLLGFFSYLPLFKKINQLDLWGDEIRAIEVASLEFREISQRIFEYYYHVAVPPLSYWLLHFWNLLIGIIPAKYFEVFYRVPSMTAHILGAGLFAYLIYNTNPKLQKSISLSRPLIVGFFMIYFLSPLLFLYSFEVRYFALENLGFLIMIFLLLKGKLSELRYIPLLLFFSLNSIYFTLMLPLLYLASQLFEKANFKKSLVFFACYLPVSLTIFKKIYIPSPVDYPNITTLIRQALERYLNLHVLLLFLIVGFFIYLILNREKPAKEGLVLLLFGLLFFILSISSAFISRYFAYHVRHLQPATIFFLTGLSLIIVRLKRVSWTLIWSGIFLIVSILQSIQFASSYDDWIIISKGRQLSIKSTFMHAEENNISVVVMPYDSGEGSKKMHDFYIDTTIKWYLAKFPGTKVYVPFTQHEYIKLTRELDNFVSIDIIDN